MAATRAIAGVLEAGAGTIIVYESTVYPGVTEDLCGPELERLSGLKRGEDFFLGYSPERINPGDREHTVDRIIKVVAGEDSVTLDALAAMYGAATTGGRVPGGFDQGGGSREGDRERAARYQHRLHERDHADFPEAGYLDLRRARCGGHQVEFPQILAGSGRRTLHRGGPLFI